MPDKAIAIGREHKRDVERGSVIQRLLHAVAHGVVVILGLDQGNGNVLVIEHIIRPPGLAAGDQLAAHDDTAPGKAHLPADLGGFVPASLDYGGCNVFGANVGFAQVLLIHGHIIRKSVHIEHVNTIVPQYRLECIP